MESTSCAYRKLVQYLYRIDQILHKIEILVHLFSPTRFAVPPTFTLIGCRFAISKYIALVSNEICLPI